MSDDRQSTRNITDSDGQLHSVLDSGLTIDGSTYYPLETAVAMCACYIHGSSSHVPAEYLVVDSHDGTIFTLCAECCALHISPDQR